MLQITECDSEETSYVVDDYPYGFTLRTQIRYWVERRDKFGERFCSQTLNPKTGKWNAPKKANYYPVVIMYEDDETPNELGYVKYDALSNYSSNEEIEAFWDRWTIDSWQAQQMEDKIAINKVMAKVYFKIDASKEVRVV